MIPAMTPKRAHLVNSLTSQVTL